MATARQEGFRDGIPGSAENSKSARRMSARARNKAANSALARLRLAAVGKDRRRIHFIERLTNEHDFRRIERSDPEAPDIDLNSRLATRRE
jgi:hypothetical protein